MIYRVLYSRFDEQTKQAMLVEDDIEAATFTITSCGALVLYKEDLGVPFFAVPNGAWIMVEPAIKPEADDALPERKIVASVTPNAGPQGRILMPRL